MPVGRQTPDLPRLFRQPGGIVAGVGVVDACHRRVIAEARCRLTLLASAVFDAALIVRTTDLVLHDPERFRQRLIDQRRIDGKAIFYEVTFGPVFHAARRDCHRHRCFDTGIDRCIEIVQQPDLRRKHSANGDQQQRWNSDGKHRNRILMTSIAHDLPLLLACADTSGAHPCRWLALSQDLFGQSGRLSCRSYIEAGWTTEVIRSSFQSPVTLK
ncbi:hypothetical protein D3C87_1549170 [compost metagenome]